MSSDDSGTGGSPTEAEDEDRPALEDDSHSGSVDDGGDTSEPDSQRRHDRINRYPTPGPYNSLQHWPDAKHPLRVVLNYIVIVICRLSPSLRLTNWLLRRIGITVGERVSWGLESTPDVFWPEQITVDDHAIIGYDVTLLCHEFLQEEYRVGEVVVGERAMIGAGAIVLPGVRIGEGAQVAANSLVTEDVPAGETVAGVPAEPISRGEGSDGEDSSDMDMDDDMESEESSDTAEEVESENPSDVERTTGEKSSSDAE